MNDEEILQQIRSGKNDNALGSLYRHLPAISRMIRDNGGTRQQAEDIFQESLIIFCRKAQDKTFTLSAGIYPYLYSVCRFLLKDELRKQQRSNSGACVAEPEDTVDYAVIATIEEEARYRLAEKIVTELGDRCRELLLLFYNGNMRLKEIAERMGYSSEQTAKNQKYKCLEGARAKYRQEQLSLNSL